MRKHLTKDEIKRKMKEMQRMRKYCKQSAESSASIIQYYVLWKDEKFSDNRLVEYDTMRKEYVSYMVVDGNVNEPYLKQLTERLWDAVGFRVEDNYCDIDSILNRKSKDYIWDKADLETQNAINKLSTAYLTIHFNILLDFGFSKKKMETNMRYITGRMNECANVDGESTKAMKWHRELFEERGIYIELPNDLGYNPYQE